MPSSSDEYAYLPDRQTKIEREFELDPELAALAEEDIANPETHDFRKRQDRTGLEMVVGERAPNESGGWERAALSILGDFGAHVCRQCGYDKFRIMASTKPGEALIMIVCGKARCGAFMPPMEMSPVQMNGRLEQVLNRGNLWVPGRN